MDRANALAALDDAERRQRTIARHARWPVVVLAVWAVLTLVVEIATAFLPGIWTLLAVALILPFVIWTAVHANRQRVTSRGFAVRYMIVVGVWAVLHMAYMFVLVSVGKGNVLLAVAGSVVVATPLVVGAVVEGRRS